MASDLELFHHVYAPGQGPRTLLLLHGTGGDENSLLRFAGVIHPTASVLSIRGNVLESGRYPRFFRRFAEGVFDEESIREQASQLCDFLRAAAEEYVFDPNSIDAFGFSNGANMGAAMLLLHPPSLGRVALVRPMLPITPSPLPNLSGKSALLLAGAEDQISPAHHAQKLETVLGQAGCSVSLEIVRAGHELTAQDLELAKAMFSIEQ